MFVNESHLLSPNPARCHYGAAVTDIDGDGAFEVIVAGFEDPNTLLTWEQDRVAVVTDHPLADAGYSATGIAAADIDGDGREEVYVLNRDTFAGRKWVPDRIYDFADHEWRDLFSLHENLGVRNFAAGRSVAAVDRHGTGRYGFVLASFGEAMRLYECDDAGTLVDAAAAAGVDRVADGRSLLSLPLISDRMDIFSGNDRGPNFLFANQGDGTYREVAGTSGIDDPGGHARGVAVLDADGDGRFDIVCGNWEGPHRLFCQRETGRFVDGATAAIARPSRIRTVIAADFDNDGYEEILFNNIGEPNRLFGWRNGDWHRLPLGDAREPECFGTGAVVGDFDGDGRLELIVAHGEAGAQPLSLYKPQETGNAWLRVLPLTPAGAPARGAVVALDAGARRQLRAIDAGSGYLCQMEPVAHFGLGECYETIDRVAIRWPDGTTRTIDSPEPGQLLTVPHPAAARRQAREIPAR
ncbi:MAG TPA: CRTAC1 family protein [Methanoculleus sp.]|nr:CRTAC1 family protein [Methanoculleus sp.]